jgi:hypothetical protein
VLADRTFMAEKAAVVMLGSDGRALGKKLCVWLRCCASLPAV